MKLRSSGPRPQGQGIFKRLFDLSLQHKLPLWGSLLIISTALAVSAGYLYQATRNLKQVMLGRSEFFGQMVAANLAANVDRGQTVSATEIIKAPLQVPAQERLFQIEQLFVLNRADEVFASTGSPSFPIGARLDALGSEFAALASRLSLASAGPYPQAAIMDGPHSLLAIPLMSQSHLRGWLVIIHPVHFYRPRVVALVKDAMPITLLVLAIVLPINWYWGRRMAVPLLLLAKHMGIVGLERPERMSADLYAYGDEVGQLFKAYDQMCCELEEKEAMKQEMVQTDRLAALGRLSAGVAHEINNPLGGLMTAVDTLKHHGYHDALMDRVLPLLDRGLAQIREIVGALLVETRAKRHALTREDIADVQTLLAKEVEQQGIEWKWSVMMEDEIDLPSTLVRQVLINLLLNAIRAAGPRGHVNVEVKYVRDHLFMEVVNDGKEIPSELKKHLFEPFTCASDGGHGLGLWVTYQIVQELHGRIKVLDREAHTHFVVTLPVGKGI
ncbi:MAG: sensor histidine kinase [Thiobacillaceae bacterium]